ncbi:hypothetical protein BV898_08341 [Hypsibius exemplaris]|uniref:RRM domain-containing protein n=1 Tax=Hypsibius exemplaris TaxID=2072580 RepID=A0A1W0WQT8_HYPEX|nr:hypothetical protein BV898_08341 [Hypsibius exemplaris]
MAGQGFRPAVVLQPAISNEELLDFLENDHSPHARTLYIGNMDTKVTRKLLYELMVQAGPIESIRIVTPREGNNRTFAFVVFEDPASVRYAMLIFRDISLFRSRLSLNFSGAHKNKPRADCPPYGPTFFDLPPGFEALTDAVKGTLRDTLVIPPSDYKSGYYIRPALKPDQMQRNENGEALNKQRRGEQQQQGYGDSPLEMRNGHFDPAHQQRNGYLAPAPHPFGQFPPAVSGASQYQQQQQPQYYQQQMPQQVQYPNYGYTGGLLQSPQQQQSWSGHQHQHQHQNQQQHQNQHQNQHQHQNQQQQQQQNQQQPHPFQRSISAGQVDAPYQYQARPQNSPYYSPPAPQWR